MVSLGFLWGYTVIFNKNLVSFNHKKFKNEFFQLFQVYLDSPHPGLSIDTIFGIFGKSHREIEILGQVYCNSKTVSPRSILTKNLVFLGIINP